MSKGVKPRLVKPTETADLNNRELLVPRLIADLDPRKVGFSEETSELCGTSCSRSVLIPSIGVDFGIPVHIQGYSLSQDTQEWA